MRDRESRIHVSWTLAAGMTCALTAAATRAAAAPSEPSPTAIAASSVALRAELGRAGVVGPSDLESALGPRGSFGSRARALEGEPAGPPAVPDSPGLATLERSAPPAAAALAPVPIAEQAESAGSDPAIPNHPALTDRFFFGLGAYAARSNTDARLNSPSGIGTSVDFEDVLGLDSNDVVPQAQARWRFSERWRLELEYFELNRSNTKVSQDEIIWGDQTYPAGTTLTAQFDIAVARLSCGYSIFKTKDKELGVALGFHLTDINAKLTTSGGSGDDGKLLAPLPVVSMYGQFALTDIWAVAGRMDFFRLEYDPYEGHVYSIGLDLQCQPWRHFGFGVGWRSLEIGASATSNDWEGEINTSYQGPILFVSTSF